MAATHVSPLDGAPRWARLLLEGARRCARCLGELSPVFDDRRVIVSECPAGCCDTKARVLCASCFDVELVEDVAADLPNIVDPRDVQ